MLMIVWGLSVRIWSRMLASLTMLVQILPLNGLRKNLPRIANRNYPYPLDKIIIVRRSWVNENKIRIRQPLSSLLKAFLLSNLFRLPGMYCFGFNRSIVFFFFHCFIYYSLCDLGIVLKIKRLINLMIQMLLGLELPVQNWFVFFHKNSDN